MILKGGVGVMVVVVILVRGMNSKMVYFGLMPLAFSGAGWVWLRMDFTFCRIWEAGVENEWHTHHGPYSFMYDIKLLRK